jgi:hypothetical protein
MAVAAAAAELLCVAGEFVDEETHLNGNDKGT